MTTSLSNITVKDGTNTLIVKANDITINGSSILATNNFVTLDTDQDIKAHKWFREVFYKKSMGDDWTTTPSEQNISSIGFTDKNNIWLGGLECEHLADGTYRKSLYARQQNSNNYAAIRVGIKSDGTSYAEAPTFSSISDSSMKIATTAWVQSRLSNLSINQINTTIDKTKTLDADAWGDHYYIQADKNGNRTFYLQVQQLVNNAIRGRISIQNGDPSGTQYYCNLDLVVGKTGGTPIVETNGLVRSAGAPINFIADNNSITPGSTPSSNQFAGYDFRGSNTRLAYLGVQYLSSGHKSLVLQKLHSDLTEFNLTNWKVSLPTPATSSNEATAATTAYVNNKHQVVSALPASPDANVFYYIPA